MLIVLGLPEKFPEKGEVMVIGDWDLETYDFDGLCCECNRDSGHESHGLLAVDGVDKDGVWVAHGFQPPLREEI